MIRNWLVRSVSTTLHSMAVLGCTIQNSFGLSLKVSGLYNFTRKRSTLIVINHKRDADGGIVSCVLCRGGGAFTTNARLNYVLRDDAFRTGFLARFLFAGAPAPVRRVLRHLNISGALRLLRFWPVLYLPDRTVYDTLLDLDGHGPFPVESALNREFLDCVKEFRDELERRKTGLTVKDAFAWPLWNSLQQKWSPRYLRPEAFADLKARLRETVARQLDDMAGVLERGDSLLIAPEGMLSPDGATVRIRQGLFELVDRTNAPVTMLPVVTTYDWMTTHKTNVFVHIGPERDSMRGLSGKDLGGLVRASFRSLTVVTMSNLAGAYLVRMANGPEGVVAVSDMRRELFSAARDMAGRGFNVDPALLDAGTFSRRFDDFLSYCLRQKLAGFPDNPARRGRDGRMAKVLRFKSGKEFDYGRREFEDIAPRYGFKSAEHAVSNEVSYPV